MLGHASMMLGIAARPVYQSKASSASFTLTKPSGVAVGDLIVIVQPVDASGSVATTSGSTWGKFTLSWGGIAADGAVYWKVLTATDVTNAWTAGTAADAVAYRYTGHGATTLTRKVVNDVGGSVTFNVAPGFTPAVAHRGLIAITISPRHSTGMDFQATVANRGGRAVTPSFIVGDMAAGYEGQTITCTFVGASENSLQLFEVT